VGQISVAKRGHFSVAKNKMVWYSIKDIVEYSNMSPKSRQSEIENDFKNVIKSIKESVEKQIEPIVKKALDEIL
jgi:hypothetical protein